MLVAIGDLKAALKECGLNPPVIEVGSAESLFFRTFHIKNATESLSKYKAVVEDLEYKLGVSKVLITADPDIRAIVVTIMMQGGPTYVERTVKASELVVPVAAGLTGPIQHDFASNPHLLLTGTTGSGKSYLLHNILYGILEMKLPHFAIVPMDFKGTELPMYEKFLPKGYAPIRDVTDAAMVLNELVKEMNDRYATKLVGTINTIDKYNAQAAVRAGKEPSLPRIFVVIDELADMMLAAKKLADPISDSIARLAQKARSAGIHLILSTQRPTVDVLAGHIKANIESRLTLRVASGVESRVVLDTNGAEALKRGDVIYKCGDQVFGKSYAISLADVDKVIKSTKVTNAIQRRLKPESVFDADELRILQEMAMGTVYEPNVDAFHLTCGLVTDVQSITFKDLCRKIAGKYNIPITEVQRPVECAILVLKGRGIVSTHMPVEKSSINYTDASCKAWVITNNLWEPPKPKIDKMTGIHEGHDYITATGSLTGSARLAIANHMRYQTREQMMDKLTATIKKL